MTTRPAVLVTGGAGYVGSHACKALDRAGLTPVTLDNLSCGHSWAVKWGPLEVGDIRDTNFVADVIARYDVTAVMHFAALSLVAESAAKPFEYYENNVSGAISLVSAMRLHGVEKLVFSSTCAVYGVPDKVPIVETAPTRPINVYGRTKLAVENFLADVAATGSLNVVMLRYFNAAGADEGGEIGESHDPESHLIPLVIRAAFEPTMPVRVFGTDYPTPDGTCYRDYVHVEDLADAHVQALSRLDRPCGSLAINLGSGQPISVRQVLQSVERVVGAKVALVEAARRPGDPPQLYASPDYAKAELGWAATRSGLDNIVASAARWHQKSSALVRA
jgi:UDP-arabinose 4-epimerase